MDNSWKIKTCIFNNNERELVNLLNSGFDPNFDGGLALRLAARYGLYSMVKLLIQHGANPHVLSETGASILQLAVYSGDSWNTDNWAFLLSYCDSSQLADGAAVAIIFYNTAALKKILQTGRCNTNIPTTLTGKTVEDLAKGYKLYYILQICDNQNNVNRISPYSSSNNNSLRPNMTQASSSLSPSVARFFNQTANQPSLKSPRPNATSRFSPRFLPFNDA